jgi:hypothetical protein
MEAYIEQQIKIGAGDNRRPNGKENETTEYMKIMPISTIRK